MAIKRMPVAEGLAAESLRESDSGEPGRVLYEAADRHVRRRVHRALNAGDGTHQLLVSGVWTLLVGLGASLLTVFVFGGVGPQGAHSNPGWLSLMVAMMTMPFAMLLLLLGGAKWLRNLRLSKDGAGC